MDYAEIEEEIVEFLKGKLIEPEITIQSLPDTEEQVRPSYSGRKVTVAFAGEEADPPSGLGPTVQRLVVTFAIVVMGRKLKGDEGIYKLTNRIKSVMLGCTPSSCQSLNYANQELVKAEGGFFEYALYFKTETFLQEEYEEEQGPEFKSLQFKD